MKAVAVIPKKANSAHLIEIDKPDLSEFKNKREKSVAGLHFYQTDKYFSR